jgi:hypothetical protein
MFAAKNELFTTPSGYQIQRSLRFRSSASAYLNRTNASSPTDAKKWTVSFWFKRGVFAYQYLFSATNSVSDDSYIQLYLDKLSIGSYTGASTNYGVNTVAVLRDPAAWYHAVCVYDSANATAANRAIIYINGIQQAVTNQADGTFPLNHAGMKLNNASQATKIGNSTYFDGYLAEVNFIDGQALTPSSFGLTNAVTGVWSATKYAGTYGTNGFYLPFTDNSAATATTIGKDFSGNGNNWTPNNISVTAGVTYDSMLDAPLGAGGGERGNYCVLNPLAKNSSTSLTNGNLSASGNVIYGHAQSTIFANSGKWYFEAQLTTQQNDTGLGLGNTFSDPSGQYIGGDANSVGYLSDGRLFYNGSLVATYSSYTTTDVVACAFDCATGKIWIAKNNTWQNSGDPAAGTGQVQTVSWTSFAALARTVGSGAISFNFGQRPFAYTPPTGFKALHTGNLGAPVIALPAQYMAATLYTGNGTSQVINNSVNGVSFQPDFVWGKARNNAQNHTLWNSVVGATKYLFSNATTAETTNTETLQSFNSNGYTLGNAFTNEPAYTYVGWQWKAGGTAVSNTAGSITSSVSANTTAGFSVVTYTGTGSLATVGHGLGAAPAMMIIKTRSAVNSWVVYHQSLGNTKAIYLNLTGAADTNASFWNNTSPTSSVLTVNTDTICNQNGTTYVGYCFTPVAGYSAFGTYTGNFNADGPFVYLGFRPRYIMIKRTDAAATWFLFDTARNPTNNSANYLQAELTNSEAADATFDMLSNGFKLRVAANSYNANGGTYLYMAFAESPFKNSLAR